MLRLTVLVLGAWLALGASALADEAEEEAVEQDGARRLREARLLYERGEFDLALVEYSIVLEARPPKVRSADLLHEGFLYYAFTLFLRQEQGPAEEKLGVALRIDPDFSPSPVTTRPDVLAFYQEQQRRYVQEHGRDPIPLETVIPSLQANPGALKGTQRPAPFIPTLGIGLRQLGHREVGDGLATLELTFGLANLAALITKAALQEQATPTILLVKEVMGYSTVPTMLVFWSAIAVDFVASLALRAVYKKHPERRPDVAPRLLTRAPAVSPTGTGVHVSFW